jgi:8'-apo-carotenoid 13,14-cleaving dioxygenase
MSDRYLTDNFAPVAEERTEFELEVLGELPGELTGRYLRNGPNPRGEVDPASHHWFIGDGMVHGVRLREGRAEWYRNRWVRAGLNNTHVIGHAGRTWALVEAGSPPVELTDELETVGVNAFFGTLTDGAFTAHPKPDPDTGDLHAVAYHWPDFVDHVQYVQVGRDGRVKRTVDVPVPDMPMIHDTSLTEHYVVVYDLPVTVSFAMVERGARFPFAWNAEHAPRIGLLPRQASAADIVWCEVAPCYVFHPMNAFEDADGNVVLDVCRYDRMFQQDLNGPLGDSLATLDRWTINPRTRRVSEERIDDRPQEFPRCHPALHGKPYRFGYAVALEGTGFPAIYKHDLKTGGAVRIDMGPGRHCAEPYFVPREGAASEDDGYLLSFVYDEGRDASELVVLDAADAARPPLARVLLPARVPYGFHGSWIPDGSQGPCV